MDIQGILRSAKLQIDEPDKQTGLTPEVPPGELPVDYANSYVSTYEVRCAFCGKKTLHKKGVTAVMEDGRRALCGWHCAGNVFDEDTHQRLKADLERRQTEALQRELIQPIIDNASPVVTCIQKVWLTKEKDLKQYLRTVRDQTPAAFLKSGNDTLELPSDYVGKNFGPVVGMNTLRAAKRPLQEGGQRLVRIQRLAASEMTDSQIREADKMRRNALEFLSEGVELFRNSKRLFAVENIKRLAQYIAAYAPKMVEGDIHFNQHTGHNVMIFTRRSMDEYGDEEVTFHLEDAYELPPADFFDEIPTKVEIIEPLSSQR